MMILRITLLCLGLSCGMLWGQAPTAEQQKSALQCNKLGVEHHKSGHRDEAIKVFAKALKLVPGHPVYTRNLGLALHARAVERFKKEKTGEALSDLERAFELLPQEEVVVQSYAHVLRRAGRLELARSILKKALDALSDSASLHEELGRLEYAADNLDASVQEIEKSIALDGARKKTLASFLKKLKRERKIEGNFLVETRGVFTIKYDDEAFRGVSQDILDLLDRNYDRLGREFGHWPKRRVSLVLYTRRDYDRATGAFGWTGGLFDGKIRLPVRNYRRVSKAIESTLAHELCHLFVHSIARRCPLWLDEGIAQLRQGASPERVRGALRSARDRGTLPRISKLPKSWSRIAKAKTVRLYYAESLSFVAWLEGNYGSHALVRVLEGIRDKKSLSEILRTVYARTLSELEADWRQSL